MRKIVVLVSGGLDSSTVLALQNRPDCQIYALSFNYGQNHLIELAKITEFLQDYPAVKHQIINLDLSTFDQTSLINKKLTVPEYSVNEKVTEHIPNTYVPARNTIFLSYGLGFAENIGANEIFIGAHRSDAANYPDCRADYLSSFENMANLATRSGRLALEQPGKKHPKISIQAPLISLTKSDIVKLGLKMGVNYAKTISCYKPDQLHRSCGICLACRGRLQAFADNQSTDPAIYVPINN